MTGRLLGSTTFQNFDIHSTTSSKLIFLNFYPILTKLKQAVSEIQLRLNLQDCR